MALKPLKMPANLAKHLRVTAVMEDGSTKVLYESEHNDKHLIFAPTGGRITALKAEFFGAWQSEVSNVFAFELVERA